MNLIQSSLAVHADRLKRSASVPIIYRRGSSFVEMDATPGNSQWDDQVGDGETTTTIHTTDWIVTSADLVLGGQRVEPRRGDLVENKLTGEQFDTLPGLATAASSPSEGNQILQRIHTIRRVTG